MVSTGNPTKMAISVSFAQNIVGNVTSLISQMLGAGAAFKMDI